MHLTSRHWKVNYCRNRNNKGYFTLSSKFITIIQRVNRCAGRPCYYVPAKKSLLYVCRQLPTTPMSRAVKGVKCTLVEALRLCTSRTSHRGTRGIALLFHDHGIRKGWGVSVMPRPLFTPGKDPVPVVQEAGWAPGPVWTGAENLAPPGFDPRTVQPVASRYTDWATRPTE